MRQPRARKTEIAAPAGAALLLQCLVHCTGENRGAKLRDIFAFGDYINHAVFEYKDFISALHYLVCARIAFVRHSHVYLTKRFRTLLPALTAERKRPAYAKEYTALEKYLGLVRPVALAEKNPIAKEVFAQAVAAYLGSAVSGRKSKK